MTFNQKEHQDAAFQLEVQFLLKEQSIGYHKDKNVQCQREGWQ